MSRDWLNLTWREKTWSERILLTFASIAASVLGAFMIFSTLYVLSMIIWAQEHRSEERQRCLRQTTNGLEIEQCR
jgi:H+/Cl- antiporter ClcA